MFAIQQFEHSVQTRLSVPGYIVKGPADLITDSLRYCEVAVTLRFRYDEQLLMRVLA